jgi:hypothetical protein
MVDRGKPLRRPPGDTLGRRIGGHQIGMFLLERLELAQESIEIRVGDLGSAVDVIELFVAPDLFAEGCDPISGVHERKPFTKAAKLTKPAKDFPDNLFFVNIVLEIRLSALGFRL